MFSSYHSYTIVELSRDYAKWHYGRGIKEYVGITGNILGFLWHFFSFKILLQTLLQPVRRLGEGYEKGMGVANFFSALLVNILMRLVGLFLRLSIMFVGLCVYVLIIPILFLVLVVWLALPVLIALCLSAAISLIIKST